MMPQFFAADIHRVPRLGNALAASAILRRGPTQADAPSIVLEERAETEFAANASQGTEEQ